MNKVVLLFILFALAAGSLLLFLPGRSCPPLPNAEVERAVREKVPPCTPAPPATTMTVAMTVDRVLIRKGARRLTLFCNGKAIKTYRVALGSNPLGKKTTKGDGRTPEGCYIIDRRKADSRYHRALHISYPNEEDKRQAAARGVSPGGDIMIHGLKNGMGWVGKGHRLQDWTKGCVAMTNKEIDEIWRMVMDGTTVEIVP